MLRLERALDVREKDAVEVSSRCHLFLSFFLIFSLFPKVPFQNVFCYMPINGRHHFGLRVSTPELCRSPADISAMNESHQLGEVLGSWKLVVCENPR